MLQPPRSKPNLGLARVEETQWIHYQKVEPDPLVVVVHFDSIKVSATGKTRETRHVTRHQPYQLLRSYNNYDAREDKNDGINIKLNYSLTKHYSNYNEFEKRQK